MENSRFKFRAWLKNHNCMVYLENHIKIKAFLDNTYYLDSDTINDSCSFFEITEFELMQYTGIKDKNGKEIFESDILQVGETYTGDSKEYDFKGWVEYYDGYYLIVKDASEIGCELDSATVHNRFIEIIGNIHENPELLK